MYFLQPSFVWLLAYLAVTVVSSPAPQSYNLSAFDPKDIITRDVAVIGGGSSGTYSAISLLDKGKSVIVIEKQGRLGGHTATYADPTTGTTTEIGVQIYHNYTIVKDYFARFDVPIIDSAGFFQSVDNFDYRTGERVTLSPHSQEEVSAAFAAYSEQLAKYPGLNDGIYLPDPIPEDLYLPFGEFVDKYGLHAAVPTMHYYNPGIGNILENPTLEQFRYWSLNGMVHSIAAGFLTTARYNSNELYTKAEAELSQTSSVLLNSEVITAFRSEGKAGITLLVRTPTGTKVILAKKLLIAIPPKPDLVKPLDLSDTESTLFSKFINAGYYAGILSNTSFSNETSTSNAIQDDPYNLPALPAAYNFSPTRIPGLQIFHYGTPQSKSSFPLTNEEVQVHVIDTIRRIQEQNLDQYDLTEPEWVTFHSHAPYTLQVSAEDIRDGFYEQLYALQGQRNTYWTGAAWRAEDSSLLWTFSEEVVLPALVEGL
ncbi:hypothetical protein BDW59DRAFT_126269 [Aspergillus cavernicola]|uniref:Amine oxidase, flavin-containing superfamily n=1 Tax=Aspergillus cavernicola TaxID=176166 RepID=A0ABR4HU34_9EURO